MHLLPAVDLRHGRVVRLRRGDDSARTEYTVDPVGALRRFADAGIGRVHVVDLDAAFGEEPQRDLLAALAADQGLPRLQLGGGLRDRAAVEWAFGVGVERVVVTSLIFRSFDLFAEIVAEFPGRVVAALDVRSGVIRHSGWTRDADLGLDEVCRRLRALPLAAVLVTDIERDGTLDGANVELARDVARLARLPGIVSGGVRGVDDLLRAGDVPEIAAVIVGKALHDGTLDLHAALAAARGRSAG